jgi:hypothetical protein
MSDPNTQKSITTDEARSIVEAVLGDSDQPTFATRPLEPGDIALVLRTHGGCEILSNCGDLKDATGKPLDMGSVGIRGMVAVSLYKLAHNPELMTKVLGLVSEEFAQNPPAAAKLDS